MIIIRKKLDLKFNSQVVIMYQKSEKEIQAGDCGFQLSKVRSFF